jgi:hypothetical protein
VLLWFLQAALAETVDAVVDVQDKLVAKINAKARKRHDDLLRAVEEAKRRGIEVLEVMGGPVLDESIADAHESSWRIPDDEMATHVDGCSKSVRLRWSQMRIRASEKGSAARRARRVLHIHLRKTRSASRKSIQVRRPDVGSPRPTQSARG